MHKYIRPPNSSSLVSHDEFNERLIVKHRLCPLSTGNTSPREPPQITDEASSVIKRRQETLKQKNGWKELKMEQSRWSRERVSLRRGDKRELLISTSTSHEGRGFSQVFSGENPSETSQRRKRLACCLRCWTKFLLPAGNH